VLSGFGNVGPKRFSRCINDFPNLYQGCFVHALGPVTTRKKSRAAQK
jgi:hypothetical protein